MMTTEGFTMNSINIEFHNTPYGELILGSFNQQLCLCDWRYRKARNTIDRRIQLGLQADFTEQRCNVIDVAKHQLGQFFTGERKQFEIPFLTIGTDFQKSVWHELSKVPFGSTVTYSQLASKIHNRSATRAVANANGANALSIIIPCHRVIGSDGNMTGYAGGISAKESLLMLEQDSIAILNKQIS